MSDLIPADHLGCSRQKPGFLAAETKPMSEKAPQAIFPID
jgi:hypothetical protein